MEGPFNNDLIRTATKHALSDTRHLTTFDGIFDATPAISYPQLYIELIAARELDTSLS